MANELTLPLMGNLTTDPELRFTEKGIAVANFTIAHTERVWSRDENKMVDGDTLFMRCTAWRDQAEHVAESLIKGSRVVAVVNLKQDTYQDKETGKDRVAVVATVVEIGASLLFHEAKPVARTGAARAQASAPAPAGGAANDPWATAPASDEPPF